MVPAGGLEASRTADLTWTSPGLHGPLSEVLLEGIEDLLEPLRMEPRDPGSQESASGQPRGHQATSFQTSGSRSPGASISENRATARLS